MSELTNGGLDLLAEVWATHLIRLDTDAERLTRRARELERRGESRVAADLRAEATAAQAIADYMRANCPARTNNQEAPDA
ncbi:MAG: hypothetical protein ACRDTG_14145 [Pseudonocardiaceae bacterium]